MDINANNLCGYCGMSFGIEHSTVPTNGKFYHISCWRIVNGEDFERANQNVLVPGPYRVSAKSKG